MLVIRENYNKKISPFGYDYVEDIIIPVEVKISITIMDILSIQEVNMVYILKFRFLRQIAFQRALQLIFLHILF